MTHKRYRERVAAYNRARRGYGPNPVKPEPVLGLAGVVARDRREAAERAAEIEPPPADPVPDTTAY